jgi:uncharacterized protein
LQENLSVLITGGSGLIGRYLTSLLLSEGYNVSHLSRRFNQFGKVRVYRWNPGKEIIDPLALEGVDYIIHLAGAGIGEKRWTRDRRAEISSSRADSLKFLHKVIVNDKIPIKALISASAIGYYGSITSEKIYKEEDYPATDFLGTICQLWEEAAGLFERSGIRAVKIRSAVVLEKDDSAIAKMLKTGRFGLFPRLGSGNQFMPWIHIRDLCNIYLKALRNNEMFGAYNAVSPHHVTQLEFMQILARVMHKSFIHPPVPSIILKAIYGEMSEVILKGSRISSAKILDAGFGFLYPELEGALTNILHQNN